MHLSFKLIMYRVPTEKELLVEFASKSTPPIVIIYYEYKKTYVTKTKKN